MTAHVLEDDGDEVLCELTEVLGNVWESEIVVMDWIESLIVPVYKEGDKSSRHDDREWFNSTNMACNILYD